MLNAVTTDLIDTTIDQAFGKWVSNNRGLKNLTIFEVAAMTGMSMQRIAQIESGEGRGATLKECGCLSHAYGLDLTETLKRAAGTVLEH